MRHRELAFVLMATGVALVATAPAPLCAQEVTTVVVNDSWTDAGRDDGADLLDTNWWTSANANGIEVSAGSLGMVTGTSGRGIHAVFPQQTLTNVGDSIKATYAFRTPATVTNIASTGGFRVGLFDTLGRAAANADVVASSGSPNAVYGFHSAGTTGLPGYMLDMDIATGAEDLSFRQHDTAINAGAGTPTGRLMGTTVGFTTIGTSPDGTYTFAANTDYTGSLTLARLSATELTITGTLTTPGGTVTHSVTDEFDSTSYDMLAFWANSNIFGSSATPDTADNGIDFSNVRIEFTTVPEPGAMGVMALALASAVTRRRRAG